MRVKIEVLTDEEEAAIQRGIARDPDSPELSGGFFVKARPAFEIVSPAF